MLESLFVKNLTVLSLVGLGFGLILALFLIWSIFWKGFALWIAAKEDQKWWFIAIMVINIIGILEIVYIFIFSQYGKNLRERIFSKDKKSDLDKEIKNDKKECDCISCEGCECNCHKTLSN